MNLRHEIVPKEKTPKVDEAVKVLPRHSGFSACLAFVFTPYGTEKVFGSMDSIKTYFTKYPLCHARVITYQVVPGRRIPGRELQKVQTKTWEVFGTHDRLSNTAITKLKSNKSLRNPKYKIQKIRRVFIVTAYDNKTKQRINLAILHSMPSKWLKIFKKVNADHRNIKHVPYSDAKFMIPTVISILHRRSPVYIP